MLCALPNEPPLWWLRTMSLMKLNELQLDDVRFFAAAANKGSLVTAAIALNVPKSSASRQLKRLESALGQSLLHRGAGRFALTDEGRNFLPLAQRMLSTIDEALDEVIVELRSKRDSLKGSLRIVAPQKIGITRLTPCIALFLALNPDVDITLDLHSRQVDFLADEADIAVRIGDFENSSLVSHLIETEQVVLCASAAYLAANGRPVQVNDLSAHRLLVLGSGGHAGKFTLPLQGRKQNITCKVALRCNEPSVLVEAARNGAGIAVVPIGYVSYELHSGALVKVLPDLELLPESINAVYAPGRRQCPKVRAFLDFFIDYIKQNPFIQSPVERRRKEDNVEKFTVEINRKHKNIK